MRTVISIFLLMILALRTTMPILDYVVNYEFISTQLCENKSKPELRCNGKCYVKKEVLKSSENQTAKTSKIQITAVDFFVMNDGWDSVLVFSEEKHIQNNYKNHFIFFVNPFYQDVFHPPLV